MGRGKTMNKRDLKAADNWIEDNVLTDDDLVLEDCEENRTSCLYRLVSRTTERSMKVTVWAKSGKVTKVSRRTRSG